jgi:hypothetical protein
MMWIVYQLDNAEVAGKFYSKEDAKNAYWYELKHLENYGLALEKVDMLKFEEWRMWKLLGAK